MNETWYHSKYKSNINFKAIKNNKRHICLSQPVKITHSSFKWSTLLLQSNKNNLNSIKLINHIKTKLFRSIHSIQGPETAWKSTRLKTVWIESNPSRPLQLCFYVISHFFLLLSFLHESENILQVESKDPNRNPVDRGD